MMTALGKSKPTQYKGDDLWFEECRWRDQNEYLILIRF